MKHYNIKRGLLLVMACLVMVGTLTWYANMLDNRFSEEIKNTLKEIAEQNALTIKTEINSQETSLIEIAERLGNVTEFQASTAVESLKTIIPRYSFKRMGVALFNGEAMTTDEATLNISDRDYFQRSLLGAKAISTRLTDYTDNADIIVFSTPIYVGDEIEAVLFATYDTVILQNILSVTSFSGNTDSYISCSEGNFIVGPKEGEINVDSKNVYDLLETLDQRNKEAVKKMKEGISKRHGGTSSFYCDQGNSYYLQYTSLGINDWYLLNLVPENALENTKNYVMNITYLLCAAIVILFTIAVGYVICLEKKKNRELEQIAYVDPITGGYTYQRFAELAGNNLIEASQNAALILMDIQDFKLINELYGYERGNETLRYISNICGRWARPGEVYARRIADKYSILALYDNVEELIQRIEKFIDTLQNEYPEQKGDYIFRAKFGIYLIENKLEEFETMQNYTIIAHSISKKKVGINYVIYDGKFKKEMLDNKIMQDEMETAYKENLFVPYYQPQVDAQTKKIIGAEALIRWRKPDGSLIPPFKFIPIAEKSGFVVKLDEYIFSSVCKQQREWLDKGYEIVPISVNLSREHLQDPSFTERYKKIREENKLPDASVELEITESAMFENLDEFIKIMDRLHELKFRILMDDFGTGYSSLNMLKTIPIDVMKLDKSFVDDYNDERGEKVINGAIQLAKIMDILVTAEGVETKEQYEFLRERDCDVIQGYYFAKPMPKEEFEKLVYNQESN